MGQEGVLGRLRRNAWSHILTACMLAAATLTDEQCEENSEDGECRAPMRVSIWNKRVGEIRIYRWTFDQEELLGSVSPGEVSSVDVFKGDCLEIRGVRREAIMSYEVKDVALKGAILIRQSLNDLGGFCSNEDTSSLLAAVQKKQNVDKNIGRLQLLARNHPQHSRIQITLGLAALGTANNSLAIKTLRLGAKLCVAEYTKRGACTSTLYSYSTALESDGQFDQANKIRAELLMEVWSDLIRGETDTEILTKHATMLRELCLGVASQFANVKSVGEFLDQEVTMKEFLNSQDGKNSLTVIAEACQWANSGDASSFEMLASVAILKDVAGDRRSASKLFKRVGMERFSAQVQPHIVYASTSLPRDFSRRAQRGDFYYQKIRSRADYEPTALGWKDNIYWGSNPKRNSDFRGVEKESATCDFDRRYAKDLTQEMFEKEYVHTGKPVLIAGLLERWKGRKLWSKESLSRSSGEHSVHVLDSLQAREYGLGHFPKGEKIRLQDFLDRIEMDSLEGNRSNTGLGLSSEYLITRKKFYAIKKGYREIEYFDNFPLSRKERKKKAIFLMGANNSFTGFHFHSSAYNALLFGRKQWYLMPSSANLGVYFDQNWFSRHSNVKKFLSYYQPLSCIQYPGEVLFIPSGWAHAVVNNEITVAMAVEVGDWSAHNFMQRTDTADISK